MVINYMYGRNSIVCTLFICMYERTIKRRCAPNWYGATGVNWSKHYRMRIIYVYKGIKWSTWRKLSHLELMLISSNNEMKIDCSRPFGAFTIQQKSLPLFTTLASSALHQTDNNTEILKPIALNVLNHFQYLHSRDTTRIFIKMVRTENISLNIISITGGAGSFQCHTLNIIAPRCDEIY